MTEKAVTHGIGSAGISCIAGYDEHDWIDWLAGKTNPPRAGLMRQHLRECSICAALCQEWSELLDGENCSNGSLKPAFGSVNLTGQPVVKAGGWTEAAAAGASQAGAIGSDEQTAAYPSQDIYRSLLRRVQLIVWRRRVIRWTAAALPTAAACLLLLLWLGGTTKPQGMPSSPLNTYVQMQEPAALAVLSAPDTARYRVTAPLGGHGDGYIWLSADSREAFLLLDRLPSLELADYQAWAVSGSRRDSLGLLKLAEGRGHLYVQADILRMADTIALSAEPKGGSRQPTTEQYILLLLAGQ